MNNTGKITDTKNNQVEYNKIKEKSDLAVELINLGIDPEIALKIIDGVDVKDEETSFLDEFKQIIIIAVIGVVAVILIGQMNNKG